MSKPSRDDRMASITSDTGPFAIVPEWLIFGGLSDGALRVYAALARFADAEGSSFPSRATLAARTGRSVKSIDRAVAELEEAGAVERQARFDEAGDRTTNRYVVRRVSPGGVRHVATVPPPVTRPGGDTSDAQNESQLPEREPPNERGPRPSVPGKVDGRSVSRDELEVAQSVLAEWNVLTGQQLRSADWLKKIIMRVREHPELGVAEHEHVIRFALSHPWWKGEASPSVVYGNGALFEQHLTQAAKGNVGGSQGAFKVALKALNEARRQA